MEEFKLKEGETIIEEGGEGREEKGREGEYMKENKKQENRGSKHV